MSDVPIKSATANATSPERTVHQPCAQNAMAPELEGQESPTAESPSAKFDPATDAAGDQTNAPNAHTIHEVTASEDRAIGARVTNSAQWHAASVAEACARPLVDAEGSQYTAALDELARDLKSKFAKLHEGDLSDPEQMLLAQAHSLQAIFSTLALRSLAVTGLSSMQMCMSVALKAQAQCRATLTALAEIKHPRQPNFIGQQNVAVNQQVNPTRSQTRSVEIEIPQSKLLEARNGERLDGGTKEATGNLDTELATLGTVNGSRHSGGEGKGSA